MATNQMVAEMSAVGSEIWPLKIWKHSKFRPLEIWILNDSLFKQMWFSYGPDHLKTEPFKIQTKNPDFKWQIKECGYFGQFSNGWASGFQIQFKIQTICKPISIRHFKIWTHPNFKSPLYLTNSSKKELQCRTSVHGMIP